MTRLTPEILLGAYACGLFPMAESRDADELFWVDPDERGIIPLEAFHVPRSLARTVRRERFSVTIDRDFAGVMRGCAEPAPGREDTWINDSIFSLYQALFERGAAHSVECWQEGRLVGGLYGVSLGGAFFGESMFHRARDASKVALVHLVARLKVGGYRLLDTQFLTEHLGRFGAIAIARAEYHRRLRDALARQGNFYRLSPSAGGAEVLQAITQTS
ncbi:MAG: leucyl/phenylalanyl-tRNA--protein transferase [Alphaproteobacteria bacterium]|nr:MAG: leucyl/phenylalanyl-tRNA--protein transferase [Alphaproteobacteria bacterium]